MTRYGLFKRKFKYTIPVHWLYGALCVFFILSFGILWGWVAFAAFGVLERWNDIEEAKTNPTNPPSGCSDWWDSWLLFIPGNGILALLHYLGIVAIVVSI